MQPAVSAIDDREKLPSRGAAAALALPLFTLTLFLSAALMFAIQPMAGKMLLPLVGGTPAGWIVAMAFFQLMLLAGYLFAHSAARASPLVHGTLYLLALAIGWGLLPVYLPPPRSATLDAWDVFRLLAANLALPFIALSAGSSTLQRLFAASSHRAARDPYFLYAASNLGSFAGLLLYPLVFERFWGLSRQSEFWAWGYSGLAGAVLLCLLAAARLPARATASPQRRPMNSRAHRLAGLRRLQWLLLAFFPSALLLAVTTHISTAIFSAPMLWVVPLALYLLTFVVAFGKHPVSLNLLAWLQPLSVVLALGFLLLFTAALRISWLAAAVQLAAFTVTALMCHQRLAARRPLRDETRLTEFYLIIAAGGALGGLLNAFVVPALLNRLIEYPVLLALSCFLNPSFRRTWLRRDLALLAASAVCAMLYFFYIRHGSAFIRSLGPDAETTAVDLLLFVVLLLLATSPRNALLGALTLLLLSEFAIPQDVVLARRNFYGVIRVEDYPMQVGGKTVTARYLYHGTTTHGLQLRGKAVEQIPTAYFTKEGPVGDIFRIYKPQDVAVIGLGAGTLNCYGDKKTNFTFYEIDPAIIATASDPKLFTFLSACKHAQPPKIVTGDGRLEIGRTKQKFDLIVLDAFSAETIPAHLLTADAVAVYLGQLKPGGLLLFNLSNRYFDLGGALARNAAALELASKQVLDIPDPSAFPYASPSRWLAIAVTPERLGALPNRWLALPPPAGLRPWTDDYTNLLGVLDLRLFFGNAALGETQ